MHHYHSSLKDIPCYIYIRHILNFITVLISVCCQNLILQSMIVFMIIGKSEPIFELELGMTRDNTPNREQKYQEDINYLQQFILYSSMDMVNSTMWSNSAT